MADYIYLELPAIPPPAKETEKTQPLYLEIEIPQEPLPEFTPELPTRFTFDIDHTVKPSIEIDIS